MLVENTAHRPDILVCDLDRQPVAIEVSFDGCDADFDARRRLGATTADNGLRVSTSIALWVQTKYREMASVQEMTDSLVNGEPLSYAIHHLKTGGGTCSTTRWPKAGFINGSVHDLSDLIEAEASPKETIEKIEQEVSSKLLHAADRLESQIGKENFADLASMMLQQNHLSALRIVMVLWLSTLLMYGQLPPRKFGKFGGFVLADAVYLIPTGTLEAWRRQLDGVWSSFFEPAVKVLAELVRRDCKSTLEALAVLIEAAERVETSRVGTHRNIGAELFPKIAEDRKESAAFYTQPATAQFLAHLTIRNDDLSTMEWKQSNLLERRKIADLACGTGTLLRAGYRRVASLHTRHGASRRSLIDLHRGAMNHGLVGTDISPVAVHLTSSSLALMNLDKQLGKSQVGWLEMGGGSGTTGSLEYLKTSIVGDLFDNLAGESSGTWEALRGSSVVVSDRDFDWILMNPPYSRTRGGQSTFDVAGLTEEDRKHCQHRWKELVRNVPADRRAGMAASFLALAANKIKPGGRVGFVLPLTAAFASTWRESRAMILREFHDVLVVTVQGGKAVGRSSLSADTGMEEMLLVATKNEDDPPKLNEAKKGIHCVTLEEPLTRTGEASVVARAVLAASKNVSGAGNWYPVMVGDQEVGTVAQMHLSKEDSPWSWIGVRHPALAVATDSLLGGLLVWNDETVSLGVPMSTIGNLFDVGPSHSLLGHLAGNSPIGAFEFHNFVDSDDAPGLDCSLWKADAQNQRRLVVCPTHKGLDVPLADRSMQQATMRQSKSTLFYARNMRWTSQAVVSAATQVPALGGPSWTSLHTSRAEIHFALALWANSSLGLITHWTQGQRTQLGRARVQIDAIKSIPCPDLSQLESAALETAAREFTRLSDSTLRPACQAHCDPVRREIDIAVVKFMELPQQALEIIQEWRWLWCNEPSVHGNNRTALRLLDQSKQGASEGRSLS